MEKIVLITGGTSGLGFATVNEFKDEKVILTYNTNEEKAMSLKSDNIDVFKCDLSNESDIKSLYNHIVRKYGYIDVLVNNAGIAIDTLYEDKTKDNFMKILEVNLVGTFLISKYFGDLMYSRKKGSIINISSTNGIDTNYPMSLDYDASKAGIISLSRNLSIQYAPYVRVNTVAPGWMNTEMNKYLDDDFKNEEYKKILLNRFAEPGEVAKVIKFLASEDAGYINNSVIRVDGGSK